MHPLFLSKRPEFYSLCPIKTIWIIGLCCSQRGHGTLRCCTRFLRRVSVEALVFLTRIQPSCVPIPWSPCRGTDAIRGCAAALLLLRGDKHEDEKPHAQDGGSKKQEKPGEPPEQCWTSPNFLLYSASIVFKLLFLSFCYL